MHGVQKTIGGQPCGPHRSVLCKRAVKSAVPCSDAAIVVMGFASLARKRVLFHDVTPSFEAANALEPNQEGRVLLVRPRRWGKCVLGRA